MEADKRTRSSAYISIPKFNEPMWQPKSLSQIEPITCDFTGSSPASHQRRCSLRRQPPTSRPCQPCSTRSTLAPNPWANIIQGVPHDVQRQWNCADMHDWHGHAHFRSSRSVSSPFCRRGTVWRASHSDCVWFQGFLKSLTQWPGMVSLPMFEPFFATLSHLNQYSIKTHFFQLAYASSL